MGRQHVQLATAHCSKIDHGCVLCRAEQDPHQVGCYLSSNGLQILLGLAAGRVKLSSMEKARMARHVPQNGESATHVATSPAGSPVDFTMMRESCHAPEAGCC